MRTREATVTDLPAVTNVLDGGLLAVDVPSLKDAIDSGDVLVSVATEGGEERTVLGVLVLDGTEITAIAVRRRRRDQGIGSRLVASAGARREQLRAAFDERVEPFWKSLGFDIEPGEEEKRLQGRLPASERVEQRVTDTE